MIEQVDLSKYGYIFADNKIEGFKKVNFIYGKNGTGKSSLTHSIVEQYGQSAQVRVFTGFEKIIAENHELNSIALGEKNAETDQELTRVNKEIKKLNAKLDLDNPESNSAKMEEKKRLLDKSEKRLEKFFTREAKKIKEHQPQISKQEYWKNDLKKEISGQRVNEYSNISNENLAILEKTVTEIPKPDPISIKMPTINFEQLCKKVNLVLQKQITPSTVIKDLEKNIQKQNFAKQGRKIHNREKGEKCAFCGNEISSNRWALLDNFFSDVSDEFDKEVQSEIDNIGILKNKVTDLTLLDTSHYYNVFMDNVSKINSDLNKWQKQALVILDEIKSKLEEKKEKTNVPIKPLLSELPEYYIEIQKVIDKLNIEQIAFTKNLNQEKNNAKEQVRFNLISKLTVSKEFEDMNKEIKIIQSVIDPLEENAKQIEIKLDKAKKEKEKLIESSQDENKAANQINTLLKGAGGISFELRLNTEASEQGHRGIYEIVQKNEKGIYTRRDVESLSDGEKNIVSFLWFIYNLDNVKNNEQNRVILFDDPMNSNDDGYQYLIIAILNNYIDKHPLDQLFILTHNNHFFTQVKPNSINYKKKGVFILRKNGKTNVDHILNAEDDLKPIYDTLWKELEFAYLNDKTIFMWNNMRRILETYNRFRFMTTSPMDIKFEIEDSESKILATSLVKSLHVNSHVGYATDVDISGKNRDQLINAFREVFISINASKDFEIRWADINQVKE